MSSHLAPAAVCVAIVGILSLPTSTVASSSSLTGKDKEVADNAVAAEQKRCTGGWKGDLDEEDAREQLENAGQDTSEHILKVLKNTDKKDKVVDNVVDDRGPLIEIAFWMLFGFVMFIMMVFCAPFISIIRFCTCRHCARCCQKRDSSYLLFKIFAIVVILVGFVFVIKAAVDTSKAYNSMQDGLDNLACTSAKLTKATLLGQEDPPFIGMLEVTEEFGAIESRLDTNSDFMNDINDVLGNTGEISDAMSLAVATLQLLSDMMGVEENANPRDQSGSPLMHKCVFCTELMAALDPVIGSLGDSLGASLDQTREEIDSQLTEEKRNDLKKSLRDSTKPIDDIKTLIRDMFADLVKPGAYEDIETIVKGWGFRGVIALVVLAGLLTLLCFLTLMAFICGKMKSASGAQAGVKEYKRCARRCSCCTWCSGWILTLPAFFCGGLLALIVVPVSGFCIILDDVNKQTLLDIGPALEVNVTGGAGAMLTDIVDQCFNPADLSANPNLLDILFTTENGTQKSMKDKILGEVNDKITAKFDDLTAKMTDSLQSVPSLANDAQVLELRNMLSNNPIDGLILADKEVMQASSISSFSDMEDYWAGFTTSARCSDFAPDGIDLASELSDYGVNTVPGIETFCDTQQQVGISAGFDECSVVGSAAVGSASCPAGPTQSLCEAGNALLNLKNGLFQTQQFRCDLFADPSAPTVACDILAMSSSSGGAWSNDCLAEDGTVTRLERTCSLSDFRQYIQDFSTRIDLALSRVDSAVGMVEQDINGTLRQLVDDAVVAPINRVADGVTCGFLAAYYRETVHGLCYQGVNGLQTAGSVYVAIGFAVILLMIVMDCLWCRTVNSVQVVDGDVAEDFTDNKRGEPGPTGQSGNALRDAATVVKAEGGAAQTTSSLN